MAQKVKCTALVV